MYLGLPYCHWEYKEGQSEECVRGQVTLGEVATLAETAEW